MTGLWIFVGLATLLTMAALLRPLVRKEGGDIEARETFDIAVFKDQLGEVDRDLERGLVTEAQAEATRIEIKRRMLAAGAAAEQADTRDRGMGWGRIAAAAVAVAVPLGAFLLYLDLGHPNVPNFPLAERADRQQVAKRAGSGAEAGESTHDLSMEEAVTRLRQRLDAEPMNVEGWLLLARSYQSLERWDDVVFALYRALDGSKGDPRIAADYGEAIVIAEGGNVVEAAVSVFEETIKANPYSYKSHYYLGLSKAQNEDLSGAAQTWRDLVEIAPPGAPFLDQVIAQIRNVAEEAGFDPLSLEPSAMAVQLAAARPASESLPPPDHDSAGPPAATAEGAPGPIAPPGPSAEDMQAAAQMSDADRNEMIRGMVQRLADRLAENPDDRQGWLRLARAYDVLGEADKAAEAREKAGALE
ncbi:MAG: c-type cytochrome biogenesis protein CcmI [Magnetovibrionaceae bacterium]